MCFRGNKIASLQHSCLSSLGTCAEVVQFHCPSRTYPAIPYLGNSSITRFFEVPPAGLFKFLDPNLKKSNTEVIFSDVNGWSLII